MERLKATPWVFISSVGKECYQFREAAIRAALRARFLPVIMETWTAEARNSCDACKKHLSQCNVVILILTDRYGSVHPESEKSYTEIEYDTALDLKIPVLAFLAKNPTLMTDKIDPEDLKRIKKFRGRLGSEIHGKFETSEQLEMLIFQSLKEWFKEVEKRDKKIDSAKKVIVGDNENNKKDFGDADIAAFQRLQSIVDSDWIQKFEYVQLTSPQYVKIDLRDKLIEYEFFSKKPENEFFNEEIANAHNSFIISINAYLETVGKETDWVDSKINMLMINTKADGRRGWIENYDEKYELEVKAIYKGAERLVEEYKKYIRVCRREGVFK